MGHGALTNAIAFHTLALALCSSQVKAVFLAAFSKGCALGSQAAILKLVSEQQYSWLVLNLLIQNTLLALINLMSTEICVEHNPCEKFLYLPLRVT